MKKVLSLCLKYLSLFTVMGSIYYLIEIIWRGYSHVSMFILAGVCGICIGLINEILSMDTPIWLQAIIGSCIVTAGEFYIWMYLKPVARTWHMGLFKHAI